MWFYPPFSYVHYHHLDWLWFGCGTCIPLTHERAVGNHALFPMFISSIFMFGVTMSRLLWLSSFVLHFDFGAQDWFQSSKLLCIYRHPTWTQSYVSRQMNKFSGYVYWSLSTLTQVSSSYRYQGFALYATKDRHINVVHMCHGSVACCPWIRNVWTHMVSGHICCTTILRTICLVIPTVSWNRQLTRHHSNTVNHLGSIVMLQVSFSCWISSGEAFLLSKLLATAIANRYSSLTITASTHATFINLASQMISWRAASMAIAVLRGSFLLNFISFFVLARLRSHSCWGAYPRIMSRDIST